MPTPGTKRRTYLEENIAADQLRLTEQALADIVEAMPKGIASGERYPESMMKLLNR